jgi:hypothetical protein
VAGFVCRSRSCTEVPLSFCARFIPTSFKTCRGASSERGSPSSATSVAAQTTLTPGTVSWWPA